MRDNRAAVNRSSPRSVSDHPKSVMLTGSAILIAAILIIRKKVTNAALSRDLETTFHPSARLIEHRAGTNTRSTECVCFSSKGYSSG